VKTCLQRYDTNGYTRLQFLQAVSHSISSYTDDMTFCDVDDDNSSDDDAASDVDRGEVQQSDTPSSSTSATTDTAASAPVDNCECEVRLVAPMDPCIALRGGYKGRGQRGRGTPSEISAPLWPPKSSR